MTIPGSRRLDNHAWWHRLFLQTLRWHKPPQQWKRMQPACQKTGPQMEVQEARTCEGKNVVMIWQLFPNLTKCWVHPVTGYTQKDMAQEDKHS